MIDFISASVALIVLIVVSCFFAFRNRRMREALNSALIRAEEGEARWRAVLEAMGDPISIQDTNLKIIYQNQAHKELMGECEGQYCYTAYQNRKESCPECHLAMSFRDGLTHRRKTSARTRRGLVLTEITSSALRDSSGNTLAGIEIIRDETARRKTEEQLLRQRAAMEASMDGIAILDENERYLYLNPSHAGIYGYSSPQELLGKSWRVLYEEREIGRFEAEILPVFRREGSWRGEATGKRRDGTSFPQELSLTVIEGGGVICVVRDISRRKKRDAEVWNLNDALQASNRDLEAFNYSLSHDLRNLLTRLFTSAQALREGYGGLFDENGRFFLDSLCETGEEMADLVDAMLLLAGATRGDIRQEKVALSDMVGEIAAELGGTLPERQVNWVIASDISALGDRRLLKVALENLLQNAWKFTSNVPTARIEFGVAETASGRALFVCDNGVGFRMEDADRLFKAFQRLHREEDFPGTGIGLATVQRIIRRHGGKIWAEGETGKGATFYFTLSEDFAEGVDHGPSLHPKTMKSKVLATGEAKNAEKSQPFG
jgi:PAS domain S-box-containing protein